MLRLRILGGLSIDGEQRLSGAALQRRRLALLAVAAAAGPRGVSRDKLLGFFWPESDEERARHALAQSLYALRRALGAEDLFLGSQDLRLNPDLVQVDLWEFERALASGDLERATRAYAGPFLDGVYLDDAPAFERWVDSERQQLASSYLRVLESLASGAEAAGDIVGSLKWWRQLTVADPLGARPALGLMRALAHSGDPAAALQHSRVYEALLRAELNVPPAAEVAALVRRLREEAASPSQAEAAPAARDPVRQPLEPTASSGEPATAAPPVVPIARPQRRRPAALLALIPSALLAGFAWLMATAPLTSGARSYGGQLDPNRLAVFPFEVRDDNASYLGEGMVDLLNGALDSAGSVRVVDPRSLLGRVRGVEEVSADPARAAPVAADFGAGFFVLGNVTELGGEVQVTASLYKTADPHTPVVRASASGERDETFQIVDRVAAHLLASRSNAPRDRLARVAAVTTSSLPALKAYLTGERLLRLRRYDEAVDEFRRAISLDTTFALAYYRLSIGADWMGRLVLAESAAAAAVRHAERLSPHDRMLVRAMLAWRRNDIDDAERRYRSILSAYPDDVETWYQLGELYFHNNPARGASFVDAREPFERVLALEPGNKDAPVHLIRIAAWQGRWGDAATLLQQIDSAYQAPDLAPFHALARRDEGAVEPALATLAVFNADGIVVTAIRLAVYARRVDVAVRAASLVAHARRPPEERALGFRTLASLAAARGRWRESRALTDSLRRLNPHYGLETQARLATVPFALYAHDELAALRDTLLRWRSLPARAGIGPGYATGNYPPQEYRPRLTAAAGLLALRLGDSAGVRHAAVALETDRTIGPPAWEKWRRDRAAMLRAALLRWAGRPADAIDALAPVHPPDEWGRRDEERFLLAELYRETKRLPEAVRWFGSFEHMLADDLPWAAPGHFMRAELLDQLGRSEEAASDYERVTELWRDCDPELRPLLEEARRRAARLRR